MAKLIRECGRTIYLHLTLTPTLSLKTNIIFYAGYKFSDISKNITLKIEQKL